MLSSDTKPMVCSLWAAETQGSREIFQELSRIYNHRNKIAVFPSVGFSQLSQPCNLGCLQQCVFVSAMSKT